MALVHIDSKLILQVLFNLVDNALKHAESRSDITLRVHEQRSKVRFEMVDCGKGVPEEERRLIFNPYYSGDYFKDNKRQFRVRIILSTINIETTSQSIGIPTESSAG